MNDNQRRFSRSALQVRAILKPAGTTEEHETTVLDLSMNGARLQPVAIIDKGALCDLELVLDGGGDTPLIIETTGTVTRTDEEATVLAFTALEMDSIPRLQELILYYASDPDKVEAEFDAHLGLKPMNCE